MFMAPVGDGRPSPAAQQPTDHIPCAIACGKPNARAAQRDRWIGFKSPEMRPYRQPTLAGAAIWVLVTPDAGLTSPRGVLGPALLEISAEIPRGRGMPRGRRFNIVQISRHTGI